MRERATRVRLTTLILRYGVRRWQFTDVVCIDESATPHSHPTLTLNTNYLGDDARPLPVCLHEQLHWFCGQHEMATTQAIDELRGIYPVVPIGLPDCASSECSSYLHVIICWLEHAALAELLGPVESRRVLTSWTLYTWIHATVLRDVDTIGDFIDRHGPLP